MERRPTPSDYDDNPERFRLGQAVARDYGLFRRDVYETVADRLAAEGLSPVLDVGCGEGRLRGPLRGRGLRWFGVDRSATLLRAAPGPVVRADATALPFPDGVFGAVAALYMLYHLPEPRLALREARRVLRPGGLFVAVAPSRFDSPELHDIVPPELDSTFDAELAPALLAQVFEAVEVDAWDAPLIRLPDEEALRRYLIGRQMLPPARAAELARRKRFPLTLTKRGAFVYGRRAR